MSKLLGCIMNQDAQKLWFGEQLFDPPVQSWSSQNCKLKQSQSKEKVRMSLN